MNILTKNKSLAIIALIYITSWIIPIGINFNSASSLMGYDGAAAAFEVLGEGLMYFVNVINNETIPNYEEFIGHFFKILAGIVNPLFIAAFIFVLLNKKYCFHFIAPCLLIMILWGDGQLIIGGYTLWVISATWLLVLSIKIYKTSYTKNNINLLTSMPLLITYSVGALAIASGILN